MRIRLGNFSIWLLVHSRTSSWLVGPGMKCPDHIYTHRWLCPTTVTCGTESAIELLETLLQVRALLHPLVSIRGPTGSCIVRTFQSVKHGAYYLKSSGYYLTEGSLAIAGFGLPPTVVWVYLYSALSPTCVCLAVCR